MDSALLGPMSRRGTLFYTALAYGSQDAAVMLTHLLLVSVAVGDLIASVGGVILMWDSIVVADLAQQV